MNFQRRMAAVKDPHGIAHHIGVTVAGGDGH